MPKADYSAEDKLDSRSARSNNVGIRADGRARARRTGHARPRPMQLNAPRSRALFCTIQLAIIGKLHLTPRRRASTAVAARPNRSSRLGGYSAAECHGFYKRRAGSLRVTTRSRLSSAEQLRRNKREREREMRVRRAVHVKQTFSRIVLR